MLGDKLGKVKVGEGWKWSIWFGWWLPIHTIGCRAKGFFIRSKDLGTALADWVVVKANPVCRLGAVTWWPTSMTRDVILLKNDGSWNFSWWIEGSNAGLKILMTCDLQVGE